MFEEMNNLVNNFIKDIDDVVDNLKLNQMSDDEEITSEQQQEWHEQIWKMVGIKKVLMF